MSERLIVLDPTLDIQVARAEQAARPAAIHTLGLLDNGKPNSDVVLKSVATLLSAEYPDLQVRYYRKPGAYRPAPSALLDQIAAENDAVLVGIGD